MTTSEQDPETISDGQAEQMVPDAEQTAMEALLSQVMASQPAPVTAGTGRRHMSLDEVNRLFLIRLKGGGEYLKVQGRVILFRQEHPEGYIRTELVEHDAQAGVAVFWAQAGYSTPDGREVYARDYGSETRDDFADYLEKASTKSVGRCLALLGYGTAQATEMDEGERRVADSPVGRQATSGQRGQPPVPAAVDVETLRQDVREGLLHDPEAEAKLPKGPGEMNEAELQKTLAWLNRRARALSS